MFTGIVQSIGEIAALRATGDGVRLDICPRALERDLQRGDSVAVAGVCLTVTDLREGGFSVDAVQATLERTTIGAWEPGEQVNLEPALRAGDPLGGHLVQGHVDGVAEVVNLVEKDDGATLEVRLPLDIVRVTVAQGSLAVDGVSLTVNGLGERVARFAIIPYTWSNTTLGRLKISASVNVEADVIGKYVGRMIRPYSGPAQG